MTRGRIRDPGQVVGPSSGSRTKRFKNTSVRIMRSPHSSASPAGRKSRGMTMKLKKIGSFASLGLLLLTVKPATAHHSFDAEYDSKRTTTISGTVTKVDWVNPHAFVFIDSKDESGAVKSFKIEMGPPYALVRGGWTKGKDTLQVGDKVTVLGAALAKDGSNAAGSMQTTSMTLANGQKLVMR